MSIRDLQFPAPPHSTSPHLVPGPPQQAFARFLLFHGLEGEPGLCSPTAGVGGPWLCAPQL